MLGVFHLLMAGWHTYRLSHNQGAERGERIDDIRGHLLRMGTYFVLAIIYYVFVALPWKTSQPWGLQAAIVVITSILLVYWNASRLGEVKVKALKAQEAARLQPTVAPTK
jgi:hypothetical protein